MSYRTYPMGGSVSPLDSKVEHKAPVPFNDFGAWTRVHERAPGDWQKGKRYTIDDVIRHPTASRCIRLISSDIAKIGLCIQQRTEDNVWIERDHKTYSRLLRRPNRYQTCNQFIEAWCLSLLVHGNTYIILVRDRQNIVVEMYVLDPIKVVPRVLRGAAVFYDLSYTDKMSVHDETIVPASEIIHDRIMPIYHPLIGISPLVVAAQSAGHAMSMIDSSSQLFNNGSRPSGILTAPGPINDDDAEQVRERWERLYSGTQNAGRVAVLGKGLTYTPTALSGRDSEITGQMKLADEKVCTALGVPPWKVGIGNLPSVGNAQILNQIYYQDTLQSPISSIESLLHVGLAMPRDVRINFKVGDLLRMDSLSQMQFLREGAGAGLMKLNEARQVLNLPPMEGGDAAYLQQQNFSVSALARRDGMDNPFAPQNNSLTDPADQQNSVNNSNFWSSAIEMLEIAA